MKMIGTARASGHHPPVTQQIHYTLEAREAEYELLPLSVDQGIGVTVWSPLAAGLLSGQAPARPPPCRRQPAGERLDRAAGARRGAPVANRGRAGQGRGGPRRAGAAGGAGLAPRPPGRCEPDRGRTHAEQLAETLGAADLVLSPEEREALDEATRPPLIYPHWHQNQFAKPSFSEADWALHRGQPETPWG
jgi:aryl-alcohol dehydrogenase-like predicted oxidoreductase